MTAGGAGGEPVACHQFQVLALPGHALPGSVQLLNQSGRFAFQAEVFEQNRFRFGDFRFQLLDLRVGNVEQCDERGLRRR